MSQVRISLAWGGGLVLRADPDLLDGLKQLTDGELGETECLIYRGGARDQLGRWLEDWMREGIGITLDYELKV